MGKFILACVAYPVAKRVSYVKQSSPQICNALDRTSAVLYKYADARQTTIFRPYLEILFNFVAQQPHLGPSLPTSGRDRSWGVVAFFHIE